MNTNPLQKHYDKLSRDERFSAMMAALGRDDMKEYTTLGKTAPKGNVYQVRDTHGLLSAFEFLAMWHTMVQLGYAATLYFLLYDPSIKVKGVDTELALKKAIQNIIEGREAWCIVCEEHNIDPAAAVSDLPFGDVIALIEIIANAAGYVKGLEPDIETAAQSYRETIKRIRAAWE